MTRDTKRTIRFFLCIVGIVICLGILGMGSYGAQEAPPGAMIAVAQEDVDSDTILIDIVLQPDGSAEWTIHYRTRLSDNETSEAFATLENDIATDPSPYEDRFGDRINQTVSDAAVATGREMSVENISVNTDRVTIPEEYGVVKYSFTWSGFGVESGAQLHVGDAIAGMFLDEATRLRIRYPDEYTVSEVRPSPTEQRETMVSWRGPIDFNTNEPMIILTTQGGPDQGETSSIGMPLVLGVLVVLLLIAGSGVVLRTRRTDTDDRAESSELLSNEEQVLRVLEANDGRMKQQELVQELEWTDAKTSQVVGTLRDEGKIEGFRLGRENVLKLPDGEELTEQ